MCVKIVHNFVCISICISICICISRNARIYLYMYHKFSPNIRHLIYPFVPSQIILHCQSWIRYLCIFSAGQSIPTFYQLMPPDISWKCLLIGLVAETMFFAIVWCLNNYLETHCFWLTSIDPYEKKQPRHTKNEPSREGLPLLIPISPSRFFDFSRIRSGWPSWKLIYH